MHDPAVPEPQPRPCLSGAGRRAGRGRCCLMVAMALVACGPAVATERRVVIGADGRVPLADLGGGAGRYAATGVVECGGVRGIGQLTGRADLVTSAAHVFYDPNGRSRAEHGRCVFRLLGPAGVVEVPLTPDRDACGSTDPYAGDGRHDWAVARLARAVEGVVPYRLAGAPRVGQGIVVVAVEDGRKTIDRCRIRDLKPGAGGDLEIRTDCTGFDGLSGAAYLSDGERPGLVGVHVGFRSRDPGRAGPYAEDHHTFGAVIGADALKRAATASR